MSTDSLYPSNVCLPTPIPPLLSLYQAFCCLHNVTLTVSLSDSITALKIAEAAHHLDLRANNPADPPAVTVSVQLHDYYFPFIRKDQCFMPLCLNACLLESLTLAPRARWLAALQIRMSRGGVHTETELADPYHRPRARRRLPPLPHG